MDDADRASLYEQAANEAALARQRAERARHYRPVQATHCELCSGEIELQRRAWSTHCASCARDAESWQRNR